MAYILKLMSFKTLIEKDSAKRYVLPAGWTARDDVAKQLECSPDRVRERMAPLVKDGSVEVKLFPVWNRNLKRKEMITAYREQPAKVSSLR